MKLHSRIVKTELKALTLTELLVVMVIVGILILLALPNLMPLVTQAREIEAQEGLKHIHMLQKQYHMQHMKYCEDLTKLPGYEANKTTKEGGEAVYQFNVESASSSSYLIKATAVEDFDNDGNYNVWSIDQDKKMEQVVPD